MNPLSLLCLLSLVLQNSYQISAQSAGTNITTTDETVASDSKVENITSEVIVTSTTTTTTTTTTTPIPTTTTEKFADHKWEFVGPIRKCPKGSDEVLNQCFTLILQDLKPKLADGVPEISLPPLDPLKLDFLDFHQGSGAVVITSNFTDVRIRGLSNFTKAEFKMNTKEKRLYIQMEIPKIRIDGTYNLGGNIFFIPIGGSGPYWFQVGDVKVKGHCELHIVNNKKRPDLGNILAVDSIKLNLEIATVKVQLLNLFNGNPILGPVINNVINENSQDLFKDIKPSIENQVSGIVKIIVNAVLENLTFLTEFF